MASRTRTAAPWRAATWTLGSKFHAMVTITPAQTISGRVTSAGAGVAGVAVSDGFRSTTTAGDGSYTIIGVPAGSYALSASMPGYAFAPATLTVIVTDADLSARDFTATVVAGSGGGSSGGGTPTAGGGGSGGGGKGCGVGGGVAALVVMLAMLLRSRRA